MDTETHDKLVAAALLDLNVDPAAPTAMQTAKVERQLAAAIAKVALHLNRDSLEATQVTLRGLWWDQSYTEDDLRAWPGIPVFPDRAAYVSKTPNAEESDLWDVVFAIGLDLAAKECAPIREFLIADVVEALRGTPAFPEAPRDVKSVSAEGQSVSFDTRPSAPQQAGGVITIDSLTRFRRYSVAQQAGDPLLPWPYGRRA